MSKRKKVGLAFKFALPATVLQCSFPRLVQCQFDQLSPPQLPNQASLEFLTEVAYSRLENLTYDVLSTKMVQDYRFCIQNPRDEWNRAFNFSSDLSFLATCLVTTVVVMQLNRGINGNFSLLNYSLEDGRENRLVCCVCITIYKPKS